MGAGRKLFQYRGLFATLGVYAVILGILLLERAGIRVTYEGGRRSAYLDSALSMTTREAMEGEEAGCLLVWDSGSEESDEAREQFERILLDMRVAYDILDLAEAPLLDLSGYRTCVAAVSNLDTLGEGCLALTDWVYAGGRALLPLTLQPGGYFDLVRQKLGINATAGDTVLAEGFVPTEDFMIGGGERYGIVDAFDSALSVLLSEDAEVFAWSDAERPVPLVWSRDYGEGRFVVDNFGICERATRGFFAASYSLLEDAFAWPVFNGSVFYLDDFPSPVPGGDGTYVRRDYGVNVADFYANYWWPDMLVLAEEYGIRYTGVIIENYEDDTVGEPERQKDTARFQYFGNMLLHRGGELGYHGYNHQPLCLDGFDYEGLLPYNTWPDMEHMRKAMREVSEFGAENYPTAEMSVYVPPSNVISEEGIALLENEFPEIRSIASTYFTGESAYTQEFGVTESGMIEQPRIVSGGMMGDYERMAALSELNMHLVFSHFIHPDDLLDEDRGAALGWALLRKNLYDVFGWLFDSAPSIRRLTGSEFAASVQRGTMLVPHLQMVRGDGVPDRLEIGLENYYDEGYLLLRLQEEKPVGITGGRLTPMTGTLYLVTCESDEIVITLAEKQ